MKLTKSQLKKIIKEEVEFLKEGYKFNHRDAALEIIDAMLDTGATSRAEILDDILQVLGGKESHRIMLMLADSMMSPPDLPKHIRDPDHGAQGNPETK